MTMRSEDFIRAFLFAVFFGAGLVVMSGSIVCDELVRYYTNKGVSAAAEESLRELELLNTDYDLLLEQLESEPNLIKRVAPAIVGAEPADRDAVYPKITAEQLAVAREVLRGDSEEQAAEVGAPGWLVWCSGSIQRVILFFVGAFMILVSFVCFGSADGKGFIRTRAG